MQSKKKDLQMLIQTTALEMFYQKGYRQTKMSEIAKEMGISVGNIYTYFGNKEDLFYTVVPKETMAYFEEVIVESIKVYNDFLVNQKTGEEVRNILQEQMKLLASRYREVVIMLEKNEETVYEGKLEAIIQLMTDDRIYKSNLRDPSRIVEDTDIRRFYRIIGTSFANMVLLALKEEGISEEKKYELCLSLMDYQLRLND